MDATLRILDLVKAVAEPLRVIAERLALRIDRRKPKLYVHFNPPDMGWCIASEQQRQGPPLEMMQVSFEADFNHDDPKRTLVITDAYPEGTTPRIAMLERFNIPPQMMVRQYVVALVTPVVGEKGKAWVGRIVFVDQFQRKHKTKKVSFRWVGPYSVSG